MGADDQLLFGFLALQNDCVSREDLIAGFQVWLRDKSTTLADVLRDRKAMGADECALVAHLVRLHQKRYGQDARQSLAALQVLDSVANDLSLLRDSELDASLETIRNLKELRGPALVSPESAATLISAQPVRGRFRILRPFARGGLGEVFVARDQELNREVALKEIRPQHADDAESRRRFVLEAEVTGGLEHPGIVPVYGLGEYDDGRPYYAMRLIRGHSLQEAIEAFHTGRASDPSGTYARHLSPADAVAAGPAEATSEVDVAGGFGAPQADNPTPAKPGSAAAVAAEPGPRPSNHNDSASDAVQPPNVLDRAAFESVEFRRLLGRFVDVCQAISYAHSRGVLHRDLKPGNIMLGKYGETLVVDWGLAKVVDRRETVRVDDELTLQPTSGSGVTPTLMGSAIGTPAYMPPEQATGRLDDLGPASDVYSLGATLFHLLTGRAPIKGRDVATLLRDVQQGAFPRPGELQPHAPPSLAAICLKAMALKPGDRYRSSQHLADDIERYLADEPVSAHPESASLRVRRWVRKHQTATVSTVAVSLVSLISLAVFSMVVSGKNFELIESNARETTARRLADARLSLNELQAELKSVSFTADERAAFDDKVQKIRALSSPTGDDARQAVNSAWAGRLMERIRSLRVVRTDVIRGIEAEIAELSTRDAEAADSVRAMMQQSLKLPVKLIDVPQDGTSGFPEGQVELAESGGRTELKRRAVVSPDTAGSNVVSTTEGGHGDQTIDVTFHGDLRAADTGFGVVFNFLPDTNDAETQPDAQRGYSVVIRPASPELTEKYFRARRATAAAENPVNPPGSLDAAAEDASADPDGADSAGTVFVVQFLRGSVILRQQVYLHPSDQPSVLPVSASLNGMDLSCVVDGKHRMQFRDVFGMPSSGDGVFALIWPSEIAVESFRAWGVRASDIPVQETPIQIADREFRNGHWNEALAAYRDAEQQAENGVLRQEAVFRQGMCQLQTDPQQAVRTLSRLATDASTPGSIWPLSAACQWWLQLLRENRLDDADAVLPVVAARETSGSLTFETLAAILPHDIRSQIVDQYIYGDDLGGYNSIRPDPERTKKIERIVRLHSLISVPEDVLMDQRVALARVYMKVGRSQEAKRLWEQVLASRPARDPEQSEYIEALVEDAVWNLLLLNEPDAALKLLDEFPFPWDGQPEARPWSLELVRAQILAAQGKPQEALDCVTPLLSDEHTEPIDVATRIDAYLTAGFLCDDLGMPERAQEVWGNGLDFLRAQGDFGSYTLGVSLLLSLSGRSTPDDTDRLIAAVLSQLRDDGINSAVMNVTNLGLLPRQAFHGVLSNIWVSKRGRQLARGIVLNAVDYDFSNYAQVLLCGYVSWRHALKNVWDDSVPLTDDEDELLWELCQAGFAGYREEKIAEPAVIGLAFVHLGLPQAWLNTRGTIPVPFRARMDFVHGCQYRRFLNRHDEARQFLEFARQDAIELNDQKLKTLSELELSQFD